jgi:cysteine desulfuration protein SufE
MIVTRIGTHPAWWSYCGMADETSPPVPPSVARTLQYFRGLSREEKMQALVQYSKRLEPLPERFRNLDRADFAIPECQTQVDLYPDVRPDGTLHFYAEVDSRRSPTIAAFLAILLAAVNDQPPDTALGIPGDFARQMMDSIGLGAREAGLNAMLARVKRYAAQAARGAVTVTPPPQS